MSQQPPVGRPAPRPNFNQPRPHNRGQNGALPPSGRGRPSYPAPSAPRQQLPPSGFGYGGGECAFMLNIYDALFFAQNATF